MISVDIQGNGHGSQRPRLQDISRAASWNRCLCARVTSLLFEETMMRRITKTLSALSISAMMALGSFGPTSAMPLPSVAAPQVSDVEQVQYRNHRHHRRNHYRHHRGDRHHYRPYRGSRHYGRHYRRHHRNNAGAIIGGLAAGAIIGGAIGSSPRRAYAGNSHQTWCANRYRTYRASDNTYVPRAGYRAQCVSPY
jgi:hypothetical protein